MFYKKAENRMPYQRWIDVIPRSYGVSSRKHTRRASFCEQKALHQVRMGAGVFGLRVTSWRYKPLGPPLGVTMCVRKERKVSNQNMGNIQRKYANTNGQDRVETRSDTWCVNGESLRRAFKRRSLANGNNEPPCGNATVYHQATCGTANAVAWG